MFLVLLGGNDGSGLTGRPRDSRRIDWFKRGHVQHAAANTFVGQPGGGFERRGHHHADGDNRDIRARPQDNGFTDFKRVLGFSITAPQTRVVLFALSALALMLTLVLANYLVKSKFGRVLAAIRDAESRVMFLGYNPLWYKLFVWTLSAMLCAIAGALYVPQVGIINPSEMSVANSIEMVIWVATGGRGTLIGPIVGAGVVNGLKTWFTSVLPQYWLFVLGAIFVLVTLFLPKGIAGLVRKLWARRSTPRAVAGEAEGGAS